MKRFVGSFFRIGQKQGELLRRNRVSLEKITVDSKLFRRQLSAYKRYYPELLEEFEGMAQSAKLDKDKLIYKLITAEIRWSISKLRPPWNKACTIFGVKNGNGAFVGRNYDWTPETEKVFQPYMIANRDRNAFIGITDMDIGDPTDGGRAPFFYNADDAINDKGLFIGVTYAHHDEWSYGIVSTHMTKMVSETCETVQDALAVFRRVPLCFPKNYFVSDRHGNMAVIEHTSREYKVVYGEGGVLIQTNHYVDSVLSGEDRVLIDNPTTNTYLRYYEVLREINRRRDQLKLSDVIQILGNGELRVCQNEPKMKTIWSLALDMTKRRYRLYWNLFRERRVRYLVL
jgi:predicted choloylglycine hydrolase